MKKQIEISGYPKTTDCSKKVSEYREKTLSIEKEYLNNRSILNICGGKIPPIDHNKMKENKFLLNVDLSYFTNYNEENIHNIREEHKSILDADYGYFSANLKHDIYDFLERYDLTFDVVTIYRFLEHVPKDKVLYFIYLLSTITKKDSIIDVIVPDYKILAERILKEEVFSSRFEAEDIVTTYELLNEPSSPHMSIWTVPRLLHFFSLEGRFAVETFKTNYEFDGRNLYIRALIRRL